MGAEVRAFDEASATRGGSRRAVILLSFGLVANLAALMTFAASLNEIAADWSLDASQSGWIGGIYFAGYAIAAPFLASAAAWARLRCCVAGWRSRQHGHGRVRGAARTPPRCNRYLCGPGRHVLGPVRDGRRINLDRSAASGPGSDHELCRRGGAGRWRGRRCRSGAARSGSCVICAWRLHDRLPRAGRCRERARLVRWRGQPIRLGSRLFGDRTWFRRSRLGDVASAQRQRCQRQRFARRRSMNPRLRRIGASLNTDVDQSGPPTINPSSLRFTQPPSGGEGEKARA